MKKHLLQSEEWEKYEKLEGKKAFRLKGDGYETTCWVNETPFGNYLMVGYGPHLKDKDALKPALKALKMAGEKHKCFFVRIEPTLEVKSLLVASGAKKVKNIEPEHTWVLDLKPDENELLAGMEGRKVRYWRNMAKKGIMIRKTQDAEEIGVLTGFLKGLGEKDHFTPQTEGHLKNQMKAGFATLYITELVVDKEGNSANLVEKTERDVEKLKKIPIAAALVYDYQGTRYYAHAATDFDHRKLMAGTILLIQMILDAKKQGSDIFDFWGITTSTDENHPWYGFTLYKKSFGGRQVDFSGTYDLVLQPVKYSLYNMARKANLAVRKLRK